MTKIDEIAPDVFRISTFFSDYGMQFNQFLVRDTEPLLYHTGFRSMFPIVKEAVAKLIKPEMLRWVGFSHFEQDECGSLNEWLALAPNATPVCNQVSSFVNLNDLTTKELPYFQDGAQFSTGKYHYKFLSTPHFPHGWDASLLFEETQKILFCSDLFFQGGESQALSKNVVERAVVDLKEGLKGPFGESMPFTEQTPHQFSKLIELAPSTLAIMHGASFSGNGVKALQDLAQATQETLGPKRN